ncbi:MAG: pteridine reductase [Gammaproteobacteria bacterium]
MKSALITGGCKRIGKDITKTLHHAGYNVVIHYRQSETEALALQNELNNLRENSAWVVQAELGSISQIQQMFDKVITYCGSLDVLVNNASSFYPTPIETATESTWDDLLNSNMKGPYFLMQTAIPEFKKNNGVIINILDIHANKPQRHFSIYSAAKAGLLSLTKSFANELAPNIRVNAVAPGSILWPTSAEVNAEKKARILSQIPLKTQGTPQDIADTVLFLVQQKYITGQVIAVDGGRSINYMDLNG